MKEKTVTYRLSREERETHYTYTDGEKTCTCITSIPKDIRKLTTKGWTMVACDKYEDGTVASAKLTAPVNLISVRPYAPDKPKRVLSEEHLARLTIGRKNNSN